MAKFKFFIHPDFEDRKKWELITADMPDFEQYVKKSLAMKKHVNSRPAHLRPCFEPVLAKDQEYHLFKKYNYFKWRSVQNKHRAKEFLAQAFEVRQFIATANFRLAANLAGKKTFRTKNYMEEYEDLYSTAYQKVVECVDYFNYNLKIRFATYATWSIRRELCDYHRRKRNRPFPQLPIEQVNPSGVSDSASDVDHAQAIDNAFSGRAIGYETEIVIKAAKKLANNLLRYAPSDRQRRILQFHFGIGRNEQKTLRTLAQEEGISTERVRQLEALAIQGIRARLSRRHLLAAIDCDCE